MLISIKNTKLSERNFLGERSHVSVLHNRLVVADIILNFNSEVIEEESIDLIEFYFSVKDAFTQTFLRGLQSSIRMDFEVILNILPVPDNCAVDMRLPRQCDNLDEIHSRLEIHEAREIIISLEDKIRLGLADYRKNILEIFENNQSERAFDIIRLIDNDTNIKS